MRALLPLALLTALLPATAVHAEPAPKTCSVGAYLISLYDFLLEEDSFSADFWFWSTCREDLRPLDVMDFPTAKHVERSLASTTERDGYYWSYVKVSGVFRQDWDVRNFPFDRHDLLVEIEHTGAPASAFQYTPDVEGSKPNRELELDGWTINDFELEDYVYLYDTVFGDPVFEGEEISDYARMKITIALERAKVIGFFKLTAGVYVSFALVLLSFFLGAETGSRTGLLVGTLFAVLVNQRVAEAVLGRVEAFTLVDQIHVTAMVFIFFAALIALLNRSLTIRDHAPLAKKLDYAGAALSAILYVVINAKIISTAAAVG